MNARPTDVHGVLEVSPVLPVVVVNDVQAAVPLARALAAGGVGIVEISARTPASLGCIERIAAEVPEVVVGAGTLTRPWDVEAAVRAGAEFLTTPGTTPALAGALADGGVPALPGCATVSEALALRERGFDRLRLFPAETVGGRALLASLAGPLPDLRFCPTGGITLEDAAAYVALPNVPCVGGTWLVPARAVVERDWDSITALAATAICRLGTRRTVDAT